MRLVATLMFMAVAAFGMAGAAQAKVDVRIDLASQTMRVTSSQGAFAFPISSARSGFVTPRGSYRPQRLERMHYSRKYHMSPMPHSTPPPAAPASPWSDPVETSPSSRRCGSGGSPSSPESTVEVSSTLRST